MPKRRCPWGPTRPPPRKGGKSSKGRGVSPRARTQHRQPAAPPRHWTEQIGALAADAPARGGHIAALADSIFQSAVADAGNDGDLLPAVLHVAGAIDGVVYEHAVAHYRRWIALLDGRDPDDGAPCADAKAWQAARARLADRVNHAQQSLCQLCSALAAKARFGRQDGASAPGGWSSGLMQCVISLLRARVVACNPALDAPRYNAAKGCSEGEGGAGGDSAELLTQPWLNQAIQVAAKSRFYLAGATGENTAVGLAASRMVGQLCAQHVQYGHVWATSVDVLRTRPVGAVVLLMPMIHMLPRAFEVSANTTADTDANVWTWPLHKVVQPVLTAACIGLWNEIAEELDDGAALMAGGGNYRRRIQALHAKLEATMRLLHERCGWSATLVPSVVMPTEDKGEEAAAGTDKGGIDDIIESLVETIFAVQTGPTRKHNTMREDALCALELLCAVEPECVFDDVIDRCVWPRVVATETGQARNARQVAGVALCGALARLALNACMLRRTRAPSIFAAAAVDNEVCRDMIALAQAFAAQLRSFAATGKLDNAVCIAAANDVAEGTEALSRMLS